MGPHLPSSVCYLSFWICAYISLPFESLFLLLGFLHREHYWIATVVSSTTEVTNYKTIQQSRWLIQSNWQIAIFFHFGSRQQRNITQQHRLLQNTNNNFNLIQDLWNRLSRSPNNSTTNEHVTSFKIVKIHAHIYSASCTTALAYISVMKSDWYAFNYTPQMLYISTYKLKYCRQTDTGICTHQICTRIKIQLNLKQQICDISIHKSYSEKYKASGLVGHKVHGKKLDMSRAKKYRMNMK